MKPSFTWWTSSCCNSRFQTRSNTNKSHLAKDPLYPEWLHWTGQSSGKNALPEFEICTTTTSSTWDETERLWFFSWRNCYKMFSTPSSHSKLHRERKLDHLQFSTIFSSGILQLNYYGSRPPPSQSVGKAKLICQMLHRTCCCKWRLLVWK